MNSTGACPLSIHVEQFFGGQACAPTPVRLQHFAVDGTSVDLVDCTVIELGEAGQVSLAPAHDRAIAGVVGRVPELRDPTGREEVDLEGVAGVHTLRADDSDLAVDLWVVGR